MRTALEIIGLVVAIIAFGALAGWLLEDLLR